LSAFKMEPRYLKFSTCSKAKLSNFRYVMSFVLFSLFACIWFCCWQYNLQLRYFT
jgi:hypothetical protein